MTQETPKTDQEATSLVVEVAYRSDIGLRRDENQDNFSIIDLPTFKMLVVADGMGGAKGGAVASSIATLTLKEQFKNATEVTPAALCRAIAIANARIFDEGSSNPKLAGMGTTIVVLAISPTTLICAHVGDSRLYRVRGQSIQTVTEDHTLVQELLKTGAISPEQAANHPVSHMLTRSLGTSSEVEVACVEITPPPAEQDIFLLCSDGLYNHVRRREILERLQINASLQNRVDALIRLANDRGGSDNITVVAAQLGNSFGSTSESLPADQYADDDVREPELASSTDAPAILRKSRPASMYEYVSTTPLIPVAMIFILSVLLVLKFYGGEVPVESSSTTAVIEQVAADDGLQTEMGAPQSMATSTPTSSPSEPSLSELAESRRKEQEKLFAATGSAISRLADVVNGQAIARTRHELVARRQAQDTERISLIDARDRESRKLSVWVQRKRRLDDGDPVNLARDISALSEGVRAKREAFEESTWRYFREAESLQYNPQDKRVRERVAKLQEERRLRSKELAEAIREAVLQGIADAEHAIADLTLAQDELAKRQECTDLEIKYLDAREKKDSAAMQAVKDAVQALRLSLEASRENALSENSTP